MSVDEAAAFPHHPDETSPQSRLEVLAGPGSIAYHMHYISLSDQCWTFGASAFIVHMTTSPGLTLGAVEAVALLLHSHPHPLNRGDEFMVIVVGEKSSLKVTIVLLHIQRCSIRFTNLRRFWCLSIKRPCGLSSSTVHSKGFLSLSDGELMP